MQIGLILVALAFPLLELAVLIKVGQAIGFWWTVLLLLAMGVAGGLLVQHQGLAAGRRAMETMNEGAPPIAPVVDSVLILLAGFLLLIPGLITDVAGLLLLVPRVRRGIANWGLRRLRAAGNVHFETREWRTQSREGGGPRQTRRPAGDVVIDGEWERIEDRTASGKDNAAQQGGGKEGGGKGGGWPRPPGPKSEDGKS